MFNRNEPKKNSRLTTGLLLGVVGFASAAAALIHPKGGNFLKKIKNLNSNDLTKRLQDLHIPRNLNELYALKEPPKRHIEAKYLIAGGIISSLIAAGTALLATSTTRRDLKRKLTKNYREFEHSFSQNGTHGEQEKTSSKRKSPSTPRKSPRKVAKLVNE